jgi:hypothetical protein
MINQSINQDHVTRPPYDIFPTAEEELFPEIKKYTLLVLISIGESLICPTSVCLLQTQTRNYVACQLLPSSLSLSGPIKHGVGTGAVKRWRR